jgi:hypothetical protein
LQFGLDLKPRRKLFSRLSSLRVSSASDDLEVLGLQYLILPFTIMAAGLALSFVIFCAEITVGKKYDK